MLHYISPREPYQSIVASVATSGSPTLRSIGSPTPPCDPTTAQREVLRCTNQGDAAIRADGGREAICGLAGGAAARGEVSRPGRRRRVRIPALSRWMLDLGSRPSHSHQILAARVQRPLGDEDVREGTEGTGRF